jgi:hypothetical protein
MVVERSGEKVRQEKKLVKRRQKHEPVQVLLFKSILSSEVEVTKKQNSYASP